MLPTLIIVVLILWLLGVVTSSTIHPHVRTEMGEELIRLVSALRLGVQHVGEHFRRVARA